MKRAWIRSNIFNLLFFGITAILCIVYIPLLLLPRSWFIRAVKFWVWIVTLLEKLILGLSYEIRGLENLPKDGPYLIAAKHQSPYETFKLRLLFDDPAIILKKELLQIPLWGLYLKKSGVIAIDRSTPERALKSMEEGALEVLKQGRPIVIFPQGTRVNPEATTKEKPYKGGIARIQKVSSLPVIPMALNSGLFWPRSGWLKSPGKVVFEFLTPIKPGKSKKDLMVALEKAIEGQSGALMNEARIEEAERRPLNTSFLSLLATFIILFGAYSYSWFQVADIVNREYHTAIGLISETPPSLIKIDGFPGPIRAHVDEQIITTRQGTLTIQDLRATAWPVPWTKINVRSGPIEILDIKWNQPMALDSMTAKLKLSSAIIEILDSDIKKDDFNAKLTGEIDTSQEPIPKMNLVTALENHDHLLAHLIERNIIKQRAAIFIGAGLGALADSDGVVRVPLTQRDRTLYAGPLPIMRVPGPFQKPQIPVRPRPPTP